MAVRLFEWTGEPPSLDPTYSPNPIVYSYDISSAIPCFLCAYDAFQLTKPKVYLCPLPILPTPNFFV